MKVPALLSLSGAAVLVAADATSYRVNARCNVDQLMRWFDPDTGLWRSYWWQGASILTSFNDIAYLDSGVKDVYNAVWDQVYTNAPGNRPYRLRRVKRDSGFVNDFYDDAGWWALAWIGAYDNTGKGEYLDEAISIWNHINDAWGAHKCGGIPWKTGTGPLAIPNSLFITVSGSIANRVGDDQKGTYVDAALKGWDWFQSVGLINDDNLVNDGVNDDCQNAGDSIWTYNQGSIIGGLVELASATGDDSYLDRAGDVADAVISEGSSPLLTDDGILAEGCEFDQKCKDGDGSAFKGPFIRNLRRLNDARPNDAYKAFAEKQAQSIWNNDLEIVDDGCRNGLYWSGPYVDIDEPVAQAVALDALTAALAANL